MCRYNLRICGLGNEFFNVTTNPNPDLTFNIATTAGVILGTYRTGEIVADANEVKWNQYGLYFTTGSETDVVITIVNNAPGAVPGNDLILDDITFRACGPTLSIAANGSNTNKEICQGDATIFTFTSNVNSGYADAAYQWQFSTDSGTMWTDITGAISKTYTRLPTGTGNYQYRVTSARAANIASTGCRVASNVITIQVDANPKPAAASNSPSCVGDTLLLTAASGGAKYAWTGPNSFTSSLQNPILYKMETVNNGEYYVTLTTAVGCSDKDAVLIAVTQAPAANAGTDVAICEGTTTTLHGSGGTTYLWRPTTTLSDSKRFAGCNTN